MASRLLRVCGALRALRASPASLRKGPLCLTGASRGVTSGGMPTDEEQATGMERKVLKALEEGVDPYGMFPPTPSKGTKEEPHLVPCVSGKRIIGCICQEDNSHVIWFWIKNGETKRCPDCGAYYKMIPHTLP